MANLVELQRAIKKLKNAADQKRIREAFYSGSRAAGYVGDEIPTWKIWEMVHEAWDHEAWDNEQTAND